MIAVNLNVSRYMIKIVCLFLTYSNYVQIKIFSAACLSPTGVSFIISIHSLRVLSDTNSVLFSLILFSAGLFIFKNDPVAFYLTFDSQLQKLSNRAEKIGDFLI
jgi:hypothetical protein